MENNSLVVVGGGHAGVEAALAASKQGIKTTLVTMEASAIGRLSCNPAIGGLAKSHLVKEVDALGGIMGFAADQSAIQYKTLNKTKGRAVWSTRAQVDKKKYPPIIQKIISNDVNVFVLEDEVVQIKLKSNKVVGAITKKGTFLNCVAVVVTCGTFLNGLIHIGNKSFKAGRLGEASSRGLTENLIDLGFSSKRLKTGTPPRISKKSIDLNFAEVAGGDKNYSPFSLLGDNNKKLKQEDCFLVNTNKNSHQIIKENFNLSAMFSGKIKGVGPRYCPSIEDKVFRFKERDSHHLFLEPEWRGSDQIYINGFSTSLPEDVQIQSLRKIKALKNVEFIRPGYAIEYDFFPPRQLKASLESKNIKGLFFAGQINGTSGYEEAAAQGLLGGVNAAKYILKKEPLILSRTLSYIGVMVDDLITSHLDEPYRMFTSRAEHRLFLRPDNVYSRLYQTATNYKLLSEKQNKSIKEYLDVVCNINKDVEKRGQGFTGLIRRPEESLSSYITSPNLVCENLFKQALFEVETSLKYEGYIKNERDRIAKNKKLENMFIPKNIDYTKIQGLSNESKERLAEVCPETLGQASRVSGVRPTDITVVGVYVENLKVSRET